jgi:hypothetical protein
MNLAEGPLKQALIEPALVLAVVFEAPRLDVLGGDSRWQTRQPQEAAAVCHRLSMIEMEFEHNPPAAGQWEQMRADAERSRRYLSTPQLGDRVQAIIPMKNALTARFASAWTHGTDPGVPTHRTERLGIDRDLSFPTRRAPPSLLIPMSPRPIILKPLPSFGLANPAIGTAGDSESRPARLRK